MTHPPNRELALVFAIALAARVAVVLAVPAGEANDMRGWAETARHVTLEGPLAAYSMVQQGNLYPPAFFYPLWLSGNLYRLCCSPEFKLGTGELDRVLRLLPVLADALVASMVALLAWLAAGRRSALPSGLAYALNPAALTNTAWMGMIGDSYYVLLVLVALLAVIRGRPGLSLPSLALAVLIKPQALAFVPLVVFLTFRRGTQVRVPRGVGLAAVTVAMVLLPFVIFARFNDLVVAVGRMANAFPFRHVLADNVWLVLSGGRSPWVPPQPFDTDLLLNVASYRDIGILAVCALNALIFWWLPPRVLARSVVTAAAVVALGTFFLSTRMHVNYAYPALALLSVLVGLADRRFKLVLIQVSVCFLIDWGLFDPLFGGFGSWTATFAHLINAGIYGLALAFLMAAARNVLVAGGYPALAEPRA